LLVTISAVRDRAAVADFAGIGWVRQTFEMASNQVLVNRVLRRDREAVIPGGEMPAVG
jgi:hypothetical protein